MKDEFITYRNIDYEEITGIYKWLSHIEQGYNCCPFVSPASCKENLEKAVHEYTYDICVALNFINNASDKDLFYCPCYVLGIPRIEDSVKQFLSTEKFPSMSKEQYKSYKRASRKKTAADYTYNSIQQRTEFVRSRRTYRYYNYSDRTELCIFEHESGVIGYSPLENIPFRYVNPALVGGE